MFEGFVADLLTRYLGKYIKTLNTENLKIGIWSGDVTLENLELKKSALQSFNNLPFTVKEGFLGKLSIKIPWNNLKTEPVIFIVDKLYIVATPKSQNEWNEEDEEIKQKKKMDKLDVYESLKDEKKLVKNSSMQQLHGHHHHLQKSGSSVDGGDDTTSGNQQQQQMIATTSFTESLRNKIVDNIQISIYNVHIRFEDTITNPSKPYSFGFTLEHLKAQSTNEDWKPTFIHTPHHLVHKLITLQNLSVYWDTNLDSPILKCNNITDLVNQMSNLIYSNNSKGPLHNYLLHPVCGSLKLFINKSIIPNKLIPAYTFNFDFDEISLELESNQYIGIMVLVEWFSILKKGERYRRFKNGALTTAKERWKFACNSILFDVKERLSKWTRGFIEKRRADRLEYISLYKLLKKKKTLTDVNRNKLDSIEREYSFEDLVYFRSLADAELRGEETILVKEKANTTPPSPSSQQSGHNTPTTSLPSTPPTPSISTTTTSTPTTPPTNTGNSSGGGWFGWFGWGSSNKNQIEEQQQDDSNLLSILELTPEQKRELYSTIDYDEHQVTKNIVYPKDYVKNRLNFNMNKGSISFRLKPYNILKEEKKGADLVILLENMSLKVDKFVDSIYLQTILENIHVYDRYTSDTIYPILMGPLKNTLYIDNNNNKNNENNNNNNNNINSSREVNTVVSEEKQKDKEQGEQDEDQVSEYITADTASNVDEYFEDDEDIIADKQPLFEMTIQENPLNSEANYFVFIETLPLEIIYSKLILDSVLEFFGNAPSNTLKDIEEAARNQIKIFKDRTTLRIQYELQNHKTVDLDININAPHILVPESFTIPSAPILVLDLGSFCVNSSNKPIHLGDEDDNADTNGDDKEVKKRIMEEEEYLFKGESNDNNNIDETVPKYLYDLYQLQLKNIQLFIISNKLLLPLVNKFDINFSIYKCIIESQTLLTKLKIFGDLPSLDIQLSQETIEILIKIMDKIRPNELPPPPVTPPTSTASTSKTSIPVPSDTNTSELDIGDEHQQPTSTPTIKSTNHQEHLLDTLEQLEMNPMDQLPILMMYNTMFEVQFSIPNVSLVITEDEKPFVKLFISDIGAHVLKRTYDTSITLSLKHLSIEDLYQEFQDKSFTYLANSTPDINSSSEHLISITVNAIQKNSPQYNGISRQIDIVLNTLHFNCNKKLMIKIVNLIQSIENTIIELVKKRQQTSISNTSNNNGDHQAFKADKNNPKIIISIQMKSLIIHLNQDNESYFAFSIKNLSFNFDIDVETSIMRFKLGNLLITDISPGANKDLGPLFGTDGEHMVEIYVVSSNSKNSPYDSTISLRMSSVKIIVIRSLVDKLTEYFEDFDIDNNKITESAIGAVEKIQDSHKKKRVLFEVDVNTPRIIFPKNMVSPYVIIADLGHISLFNCYSSCLEDPSIQSEEIYIYASSINFHSCKFVGGKIVDETIEQLSNQVNLYICIESYYQSPLSNNSRPTQKQKVLGELSPIVIGITDQQYSLLVSIIKSLVEPNLKKKKKKKRTIQRLDKHNLLPYEANKNDIKDQISFRLPQISLEIFRKNKESVVRFEVDQLDFSLIDYLYDYEYTVVTLNSIELIDTRKSSNNQFRKLLSCSKESKEKELTIDICEKRNGDMEMNIALVDCRANLVSESIVSIIDFIMPGVKALKSLSEIDSPVLSPLIVPDVPSTPTTTQQPPYPHSDIKNNPRSPVKVMMDEKEKSNRPKNNTIMFYNQIEGVLYPQKTIHFQLKKVEVCMIEQPSKLDSRALIVKGNSFIGKVAQQSGNSLTYTDIQTGVDRFELFKCKMDDVTKTATSIIDPLAITVTISQVQGGDDPLPLDILISANPIHITFSYQDFQLCQQIYIHVIDTLDHLVDDSINSNSKNKAMNNNNNNNSVSKSSDRVQTPTTTKQQQSKPRINFQSHGVSLTVLNDMGGKYGGVADINLSNISFEVIENKVLMAMYLTANYFNSQKSAWEPFIEHWGFKMAIESIPNVIQQKPSITLVVTSSKHLNVNISKALFDMIGSSINTLKELKILDLLISNKNGEKSQQSTLITTTTTTTPTKSNNPVQLITFSAPPSLTSSLQSLNSSTNINSKQSILPHTFILRNDTGVKIEWWISSKDPSVTVNQTSNTKSGNNRSSVEYGNDACFNLEEPSKKFRDATSISTYRINLSLLGWKDILNIPIDKSGIHFYTLHPLGQQNQHQQSNIKYNYQQLVFEVTASEGNRLLIVRSNTLLINQTQHRLEYVDRPSKADSPGSNNNSNNNSGNSNQNNTIIGPMESKSLPLLPLQIQYQIPPHFRLFDRASGKWSTPIYCENPSFYLLCIHKRLHYVIQVDIHYLAQYEYDSANNNNGTKGDDGDETGGLSDDSNDQLNNHIVTINPPVTIENTLSCTMSIKIFDQSNEKVEELDIKSGESISLYSINTQMINMMRIRIHGQKKYEWSNLFQITQSTEREINGQTIKLVDSDNQTLVLKLQQRVLLGTVRLSIFSDYWLLNRTGLPILYQTDTRQLASGQIVTSGDKIDYYKDPREWYDLQSKTQPPLLFSVVDYENPQFYCKVDQSQWSYPINLKDIKDEYFTVTKRQYSMDLSLQFTATNAFSTTPEFYRTKQIAITPRYVIINNLPVTLYYCQKGSPIYKDYEIKPGETIPFHFLDRNYEQLICVKLSPKSKWSGAFSVTTSKSFHLGLELPEDQSNDNNKYDIYIPFIQIVFEKGIKYIIFNQESKDWPPYRIENQTPFTITVSQLGSEIEHTIQSKQKMKFVWDEPLLDEKVEVKIVGNQKFLKTIRLDKLYTSSTSVMIKMQSGYVAKINTIVTANGPTNVLILYDANQPMDDIKQLQQQQQNEETHTSSHISVDLLLGGLNVSLIDSDPKELIFFNLTGIHAQFRESYISMEQDIKVTIQDLKIDNQLYNTPYPEMASRDDIANNSSNNNNGDKLKEMLMVSFSRSTKYQHQNDQGIDYIKQLKFDIQPLKIQLDETLIYYVSQLLNQLEFFKDKHVPLDQQYCIPQPESVNSKRLYFESLVLPPIDIKFGYASTGKMIGSSASAIANIDNASLHLKEFNLDHQFTSASQLGTSLFNHFKWEFGKIILYSDIFGAPMSLTNSLSRGINDLINESRDGLNKNDLGGIYKGTSSLVKNSLYGIFNSASRITGSLGKVMAPLSLDSRFQQLRQNTKAPPRYFGEGISMGLNEFARGISMGLAGIYKQPIQEVQSHGPVGLIAGITKGVIGSVMKPAIGAIDMISHASQGLRNAYKVETMEGHRVRPPRFIDQDGTINSFNWDQSYWQEIISTIEGGVYAYKEWYIHHFVYYQQEEQQQMDSSNTTTTTDNTNNTNNNLSKHYILITSKHLFLIDEPIPTLLRVYRLKDMRIRLLSSESCIILDDVRHEKLMSIQIFDKNGKDCSIRIFSEINDILQEIKLNGFQ